MPFEIIEIGAVKVNEKNECIEEFHEYICPQRYLELHHHTQELLQIDMEVLEKADGFLKKQELCSLHGVEKSICFVHGVRWI